MVPDLKAYRWIVVNSSGGKDSQTALREVVLECQRQGVSLSHVVVSHQDLGRSEWKGTKELAELQAGLYGLEFIVTRYRSKAGENLSLLDYIRKRGKWPSNKQRYCTSDFKRGPGARVITALSKREAGDILQVFGFRAEESPARAKKEEFSLNTRLSTKGRQVHDWLPILNMTEDEVWRRIKQSCVPYHRAYELGMKRLSCVFCIFAPRAALITAGTHNPDLLDEYVSLEKEIGHDFQNGKPLADIKAAIARGEKPTDQDGAWNM